SVPVDQIEPLLPTLLRQFAFTSDASTDEHLSNAAAALSQQVPAPHAEHVFERVFMNQPENAGETGGFAIVAFNVVDRVPREPALAAAAKLVEAMGKQNAPAKLAMFTGSVARYLEPAVAQRLFLSIVSAIRNTTAISALAILGSASEAVA